MSRLLLIVITVVSLHADDTIQAFGHRWHVPVGDDWRVERSGGVETLHLLVPRPSRQPRRPTQYALAETEDFAKVTVEVEMKKEPAETRNRRTSLMIVFAYQDEAHFNYAHLSVDTGEQVAVHNGIFHVYGGDRVRISSTKGPPGLTGEHWHKVRLEWVGATGRVDVFVDDTRLPSLTAYDLSLTHGKVGLGSFFDMGSFRRVKITGTAAH